MKTVRPVAVLLLIALLSVNVGCTFYRVTDQAYDIRGSISSLSRADGQSRERGILGTVLVEGVVEKDTKFDRASVTVKDETRIFERKGGSRRSVTFDDLRVGQKVGARFAGPVLESNPVQATAAEIVILER
jgi:beta-N-acetylhexosaminidase